MSKPTAKRKKFYCAAVYTSDAYALDVTDAIAAAGTEPAWQDAEIFKKQLFAKSVNADGYALWAEYIGTPNTVMPANGDVSALTDKLQSTGDFTRAAIDALIVAIMGKAKYTLTENVNALTIVFRQAPTRSVLQNCEVQSTASDRCMSLWTYMRIPMTNR